MSNSEAEKLITLDLDEPVWDRFFMVAPLFLIRTHEDDDTLDLAPKHRVTPVGWENYFGFVCTANTTPTKISSVPTSSLSVSRNYLS